MITDIALHKPEPIVPGKKIEVFNRNSDIKSTVRALEAGKPVLITAFYSNGMVLLKEIQMYLKRRMPNKTFKEQREFREAYRKMSNLMFIEIVAHKLNVKKAPSIGWLAELYPETSDFILTFPQVQGLNSSWQSYQNGISIPVLRNKIHPYYGTYYPTRFDHLILFDNWLKRYKGSKKTAIDIGIGSGVLAFQMVKHGFQKVFGTDTNPNAIVGLSKFMKDTKLSRKVELSLGHLFGKWEKQTELIVFNPPWLPVSEVLENQDEAMYYDKKLFPDFFAAADKMLLPEGKIVVLFSNLAQITEVTKEHPIQKELDKGGRFKLVNCLKKNVKLSSDKTKQDQHWRSTEEVELWELEKK